MLRQLVSVEEFDELLSSEEALFVLKHSLTCPISHAAYEEYNKFVNSNEKVNSYYLAVQDSKPLSNYIAEKFQLEHESPQAILFVNSNIAWHASHWKITNKSLEIANQDH